MSFNSKKGQTVDNRTGAPRDGHEREHTSARGDLRPDGQHESYWVLSPEERAKGFVRPVRRSYLHVGIRPKNPTRPLTAEETDRHSGRDYVAFEPYPDHETATGRFWTQEQLTGGCRAVTTMSQALAETYARDPSFYGSTFCCICSDHFPVGEFTWKDTDEVVGS